MPSVIKICKMISIGYTEGLVDWLICELDVERKMLQNKAKTYFNYRAPWD